MGLGPITSETNTVHFYFANTSAINIWVDLSSRITPKIVNNMYIAYLKFPGFKSPPITIDVVPSLKNAFLPKMYVKFYDDVAKCLAKN